jgi:VWFA-related protein
MIGSRLAVPFLCTSIALAQSPSPSIQQPPVLTANSTIVLVPALVTTKNGEPVFTLTASDFIVTDDGVPQPLTLEENSGDDPLALVVAIQTGGAGARQLDKYRNLPILIEAIAGNVPHQIAIVTFDSSPKLRQDFTPDSTPLEDVLHNLSPGDNGAAILDTIGYAVDLLKDQPAKYRRAILLISETLDKTSNGGSHIKLEDALRVIDDTNTAIYSLGFSPIRGDATRRSTEAFVNHTPGPRHGCMAKDTTEVNSPSDQASDQSLGQSESPGAGSDSALDSASGSTPGRSPRQVANQAYDCLSLLAPPLALAKMAAMAGMDGLSRNVPETVAQLTGGEYFQFKDARSLERGLATISNHVPNRYMLSFHPQSPHTGLHAVTLRLKNYPNLELSARDSYWVDSDSNAAPQPQALR